MRNAPSDGRDPGPVWLALLALLVALPSLGSVGAIRFREVSRDWGIDFRHHHGGSGKRYLVETITGGLAVLDYDLDGDEDLLFVDAAALPGYRGEPPRTRLFRNDGAGRFVDVTEAAGLDVVDVYGCGVAAGDVDNDGDLDVYITAFGRNLLYSNDGDGSFTEAGEAWGVDDDRFAAAAAFADADLDGDLDLYVANYVEFSVATHRPCVNEELGVEGYCRGLVYPTAHDLYYRNDGGRFSDQTRAAGFAAADSAGLGVIWGDVDNDGWPDLYVANDGFPNFLFRNRGNGTFEDASLLSGTAYSGFGAPEGGMGVDLGDVDENGFLDLVVTNFEMETNALYSTAGAVLFTDSRFAYGVAEPSFPYVGFGVAFADLDLDGDLDLLVANGHVLDNAEAFNPLNRWQQPNQVFENLGRGRFRLAEGAGVDVVLPSRGLATGDLDGDGDLDFAVNNVDARAEVYENVSGGERLHWSAVELLARSGNRFGIGARVELALGERRLIRERRTASSYLSQNALPAHFGLGERQTVERLTVRWPGGGAQRFLELPANHRLLLLGPRVSAMSTPEV